MKKQLCFCIYLLCIFISCTKTNNYGVPDDDIGIQEGIASVKGMVLDNVFGTPIKDAIVRAGNKTTVTDSAGNFILTNCQFKLNTAIVTVEKSDYFKISRTFIASEGKTSHIKILLTRGDNGGGSINATTGGSVGNPFNGQVTLPANAVIKEDGSMYTGVVNVKMAWLDPTRPQTYEQMPGNLRGINASGVQQGIETFGMLMVELYGGTQKLQIAPGKTAKISVPIPSSLLSRAPAAIPMWYFNDSTGLWKEEGVGNKVGTSYEAFVKHFTVWNWDAPYPFVNPNAPLSSATIPNNMVMLSGTVVDSTTQQPRPYTTIRVTRLSTNAATPTYTNNDGGFRFYVPYNEAVKLEVIDQCNMVITAVTTSILTNNANLGIIKAKASNSIVTLNGRVNKCSGQPVQNGHITILIKDQFYKFPIMNGSYSAQLDACNTPAGGLSIFAADYDDMKKADPLWVPVSVGVNNVSDITTCTTIDYYMKETLDGSTYIYYNGLFQMYADQLPTSSGDFLTYIKARYHNGCQAYVQIFTNQNGNWLDKYSIVNGPHPTILGGYNTFNYIPVNVQFGSFIQYGNVGEPVIGQFNKSVKDAAGLAHTLQVYFKVKRSW